MHELGLLRSVVETVERAAARAGATGVQAVGLRVGTLSGALPDALVGAWPLATAGTALAGARLDVEPVVAAIWCPGCAAEQPVDEFYALTCPVCGTPSGTLVRGRELAVAYADLDLPDDGPAGDAALGSRPLHGGGPDGGPPDDAVPDPTPDAHG